MPSREQYKEESYPVDVYQPNGDFNDGYSGSVDVESVKGMFYEHGRDSLSGAESMTPNVTFFDIEEPEHELLEITNEADDCTRKSFECMKRLHEDNNEDYCSLYGKLLAMKLRKLDERTREIVMNDIDNLIFRAKMNRRASNAA